MKKISSCRVCQSTGITDFLDLGNQPYANSLLKSPDQKEKFYPLSLSFCSNCSLVQLNHTANPKELFSNYLWVTATSKTANKYAKAFATEVIKRVQNLKQGYVLEVASNDGTFLVPFIKKNIKVLGIDPAQNIADLAVKNGIPTQAKFFGVKAAEETVKDLGPAKVVIARNVLPHVAKLHDFVLGMYTALADDGLLVIEFHYAQKIYQELHYDSIYHEHLCYFTLRSFEILLNQFNFYISDIGESPISGGSLVVYATKGKTKESKAVSSYRKAEKKIKVNELESWQDFAKKVINHRKALLKILNKYRGKRIIGYGASARSSTLLNYCQIDSKILPVIADQNPLKKGLYTAGTHILIESPETAFRKKPDIVVILAWNFAKEIIKILKEKFKFHGVCIIPLPNNPGSVKLK